MIEWDDLKFFLAAARTGSMAAAGLRLGADTATVSRRVKRLEAQLRTTLFLRSPNGLELSSGGLAILRSCEDAEASVAAVMGVVERGVSGVVRISAAEGFGSAILAPALPKFLDQHPSLTIELAAQSTFLSPTRREADIAITLSAPASSRLVAEPLADYSLGLYASRAYLGRHGTPRKISELKNHRIVGYIDDLTPAPELRYLDQIAPSLRPQLASSSVRAQREFISAGGGIGILPHFLAAGLRSVLPNDVRITRRFWIGAHKDIAETARLRAVREWLFKTAQLRADDLSPPQPA